MSRKLNMTLDEQIRIDNSIGSLRDFMSISYRRLICYLSQDNTLMVPLHRYMVTDGVYYLIMCLHGTVVHINFNESTVRLRLPMLNNKTIREVYGGRDKKTDRMINNLEEDVRDYSIAVNRLNKRVKNDLFRI